MDEKEFLKRLLETFRIEAEEHIQTLTSGLIKLEKGVSADEQSEIVELIYREAHSLKGSARAVDIIPIETVCHGMENIFREFKHTGVVASEMVYDIMHKAIDVIAKIMETGEQVDVNDIVNELQLIHEGNFERKPSVELNKKPVKKPERLLIPTKKVQKTKEKTDKKETFTQVAKEKIKTIKEVSSSSIRISSTKIDNILLEGEEFIFLKQALKRFGSEFSESKKMVNSMIQQETILKKINDNMQNLNHSDIENFQKYMKNNENFLKNLDSLLSDSLKNIHNNQRSFSLMIDAHLESIKSIMMLPFSTLLDVFPKMVRDISKEKNKKINLSIVGGDIEIDKRILEKMKNPLVHIVRNGLDHGIESPEERLKNNKPEKGNLSITVYQEESDKVKISVKDDGCGINIEKIKDKAIDLKLFTKNEINKLTEKELISLIFRSEFSTSSIITDLSGRGLGLAILKEKVENLSGTIDINSQKGIGTEFIITLPLTLSTFRGILVKSGGQKFIIPTINVVKVLREHKDSLKTVENNKTLKFDNEIVSIVSLSDILAIPAEKNDNSIIKIIILETSDEKVAFIVEDILFEEEVLVKDMGSQLIKVTNISGATVLGSGEVVLVLNTSGLIHTAINTQGQITEALPKGESSSSKDILVAEDSITSRMLLKNILESVGYSVTTAVDGAEAWRIIREQPFDAIISDLEMPRMNGFELTEKIKSDPTFENIPVILVTALETREDKEKGIDAGADAYIIKSSFDQSNLLGALQKLI